MRGLAPEPVDKRFLSLIEHLVEPIAILIFTMGPFSKTDPAEQYFDESSGSRKQAKETKRKENDRKWLPML
jgi:hypothetical protein